MGGVSGRPGANIAAGMPQGQAQQGAMPSNNLGPNVNNFAPGPAIPTFGGMRQQFNPTAMIQRAAFNPMAAQAQSNYGAPRPIPQFQPQLRPNMPGSASSGSDPAKPSDYQQMRDELTQLRDWQARYTGNDGGR